MKTIDDVAQLIKTDSIVPRVYYTYEETDPKMQQIKVAQRIIIDFMKRKFNIKNEESMNIRQDKVSISGIFRYNFKQYAFTVDLLRNENAEMLIKFAMNRHDIGWWSKHSNSVMCIPISENMFDNVKFSVMKPDYNVGDVVCLSKSFLKSDRFRFSRQTKKHEVYTITRVVADRYARRYEYYLDDPENYRYCTTNLKRIKGGI